MKSTIDYINTLIKEKENLTALCKSHIETIRQIKRELNKLNSTITKKDKRILKLESESPNAKIQKELDKVKNELNKLKKDYDLLQRKYNDAMSENAELKRIFDEIETLCDSD
jgi:chromosome segregation ATPase